MFSRDLRMTIVYRFRARHATATGAASRIAIPPAAAGSL
jgi:hypothetical protein